MATAAVAALIAGWLRRIADWLDPPPSLGVYVAAAIPLVARWEAQLGSGFGEAKRRQVMAGLMDTFPGVSKRVLSKALESALDEAGL